MNWGFKKVEIERDKNIMVVHGEGGGGSESENDKVGSGWKMMRRTGSGRGGL